MNDKQIMLPGVDRLPVIRTGFIYLRYDSTRCDWCEVIDRYLKMNPGYNPSKHTLILIPLESGFIE